MACGTPVVCSKAASLPEVGGDAVLYVNPLSIEDIAYKLRMIVQDQSLRAALIKAGMKQVTKFTWENWAMETYKGYEKMKDILLNAK